MQFTNTWITSKIEKDTIEWASLFAKELVEKRNGQLIPERSLSTSQIRKFFGEVKRIQAIGYEKSISDILMLKPKLAYAAGRQRHDHPIQKFYKKISTALDLVTNENHFENFVKILEAIVAYHKVEGGK